MRFFSIKMGDKGNYLALYCTVMLIFGIIFGTYLFYHCNDWLLHNASNLFFIKNNDFINDYNFYIISTSLFIILSLICSTSFLGIIFNGFLIYTKGIQITFSLLYLIQNIKINFSTFTFIVLPQLIIEIFFIYIIGLICSKLAVNTFMVSFIVKDNFKPTKIMNYLLDYIIVILIILALSMAFRVYIIG